MSLRTVKNLTFRIYLQLGGKQEVGPEPFGQNYGLLTAVACTIMLKCVLIYQCTPWVYHKEENSSNINTLQAKNGTFQQDPTYILWGAPIALNVFRSIRSNYTKLSPYWFDYHSDLSGSVWSVVCSVVAYSRISEYLRIFLCFADAPDP